MYSLGSLGNPGGLQPGCVGEAGYVDMQIHISGRCTANRLMSIMRLKICPTGGLDEAWALAISPKSLTAIPPSPPSDSATKGTNS